MKLIEVSKHLYIRGALSDRVTEEDLVNMGISHFYSLRIPGQPSLVEWSGYHHIPLVDGKDIPKDIFAITDSIVAHIQADESVMVACQLGYNRAGLVVSLALSKLFGWSGLEIINVLRKARPSALKNSAFYEFVKTL